MVAAPTAGLHYYSRTQAGRAAANNVPGTCFTADGNMQLALPVHQPSADRNEHRSNALSLLADPQNANRLQILMSPPARPDEENAPRAPLRVMLLLDLALLLAMLAELSSVQAHREMLNTLVVAGFIADTVGAAACQCRTPRVLHLFALGAFFQFLLNCLYLHNWPQLMHCIMQPLLVHASLALRRQLIPLWLSNGPRTRAGAL